MRGKRSKQYRKLMQQYSLTFNFREPYQVLIDAQMIQDTFRFKMDLLPALKRTLHGEVKPMITQCSIRHLFALSINSTDSSAPPISQADKTSMLDISRSFTLRRCNHHTLPEPLSTLECYQSVVDPSEQGTNKHRYVLATQDDVVRAWARSVKGVPVIYVKRSVMVMEPMAHASIGVREREEKGKLRAGIKKVAGNAGVLGKRKRAEEDEEKDDDVEPTEVKKKKKKVYGAKGPNPLSVRKKKTKSDQDTGNKSTEGSVSENRPNLGAEAQHTTIDDVKKKRRKKHKTDGAAEGGASDSIETHSASAEAS